MKRRSVTPCPYLLGMTDEVRRGHVAKLAAVEVAAAQHMILTTTQAQACGLSKSSIHRLVKSGEWQSVFPRVVAATSLELSSRQQLAAACMWAGAGAAASHRSAGALWELDGVESPTIEITRLKKRTHPTCS